MNHLISKCIFALFAGMLLSVYYAPSVIAHDSDNGSATIEHNSRYSGTTGSVPITAKLLFLSNDHVTGSYHSSKTGRTYRLQGHNHTEGKVFLQEMTSDGNTWFVSASCTLRKKTENGKIVWTGTMKNTDGRQFSMTLRKAN